MMSALRTHVRTEGDESDAPMRVGPRRRCGAEEIGDGRSVVHEECPLSDVAGGYHVRREEVADLGLRRVLGRRGIGVNHSEDECPLSERQVFALERDIGPEGVL